MSKPKIAIVFHSVCGNTCQLAQCLATALEQQGATVMLRRLHDAGYAVTADAFPASRQYKDIITAIPIIDSPAELLDCDAIVMGSPTYFGNVSAPVKAFIDSFVDYFAGAPFAGKAFASLATAGTAQGGVDCTLHALNTFAMHLGMVVIAVPSGEGVPQPAYGLCHYSGDLSDQRMSDDEQTSVAHFAAYLCRMAHAIAGGKA